MSSSPTVHVPGSPRPVARLAGCALVAALLALAGGCGGGGRGEKATTTTGAETTARVLRVPDTFRTIQAAVDASRPGDLVLVGAGTYHEAVRVEEDHPRIVIRGIDRNRVVLDGRDELADGIHIEAAGVAVENLTVRHFAVNGVVWAPEGEYAARGEYLQGWRGSYLTVYDNGLYGVYAFGTQRGRFDHVFASGHPDSGIYVGRCKPCLALVRDSVAEHNHVGYEGTNSGGAVTIVDNTLSENRVGVQVNSLTKERSAPQVGSLIAGNVIADNQDARAPRGSDGFGAGVVIEGGRENVVRDNRITGHRRVGVVVLNSPDYAAQGNRVTGNVLQGNRLDLGLVVDGPAAGNCFAAPGTVSTSPPGLTRLARCGAPGRQLRGGRLPALAVPGQVDYRRVPAPRPQPSMPAARTAPARPAVGLPERIDEGAIRTPGASR